MRGIPSQTSSEQDVVVDCVPVPAQDILPFTLQLCSVGNPTAVLTKAQELGLTGEDLHIVEQDDIADLLPDSKLQQRKFYAICKYLQEGGTLRYGMTMSDIYNGDSSSQEKTPDFATTTQNNDSGSSIPNEIINSLPADSQAQAASTDNDTKKPTANQGTSPVETSHESSGGCGGVGCGSFGNLTSRVGKSMTEVQTQLTQIKKLQYQFGGIMDMLKSFKG